MSNEVSVSRRTRKRPEKLSDAVAREIVRDIRGMAPGSMLPPESAMTAEYDVGRGSLREALRILEFNGLLTMRPGPGGGPMVAAVDSQNFAKMASLHLHLSGARYRDVIEARLVMEPVMARLAATRQDRDVLEELIRYSESSVPANDNEYLHRSTEFHSLLSGMSTNPVLDLIGRSLKDLYTDRIETLVFPAETRQRVDADHREIARLILAGDADGAESAMRAHMEEFLSNSASKYPGILDEIVDWQ
jgi:DNA-binding FadR family transcriptional regulator